MACLQCCFEGAEYVELLQVGTPRSLSREQTGALDADGERIAAPERLRPPRDLRGILAAAAVTLIGTAAGALAGLQCWSFLRRLTASWCKDADHFMSLGLEAAHLGKAGYAAYCNSLRDWPGAAVFAACLLAATAGPLALRLTFGRVYFTSWTEAEELDELLHLYRERSVGARLVLRSWRWRTVSAFIFDIVVWMWLRYYLDLYLDVQAMKIFWENGDPWFFFCNLLGIVLGLFWTAVEFHKMLREEVDTKVEAPLPGAQVLVVGLLLPLAGAHMTYLTVLSLATGVKHRFLYISALAEAILESAVSAFVQTYAVVFSRLSVADKMDLYVSIALSFVSIGYAFASLDRVDGGELLVSLPGDCGSSNARFWSVLMFRISEVTSRATSLALFQCVWRPYGLFAVVFLDSMVIIGCCAVFQYNRRQYSGRGKLTLLYSNIIYSLPSAICLMTPMLEKDTPLTMAPGVYYALRLIELCLMACLMGLKLDWHWGSASVIFDDDALVVTSFCISTLLMVLLGFYIRMFLANRVLLEAPMKAWSQRPFTVTQQALRNRIVLDAGSGGASARRGARDDIWTQAQWPVMWAIEASPSARSWEVRARLRDERTKMENQDTHTATAAEATDAEWEALFLGAKACLSVGRAIDALEVAIEGHRRHVAKSSPSSPGGGDGAAAVTSGNDSRRTPRGRLGTSVTLQSCSTQALDGSAVGLGRRGDLVTGTLVRIRARQGGLGRRMCCLTASAGDQIKMQWAHDDSDQKFVLEPAHNGRLGSKIFSGDSVRLRALQTGAFVGLRAVRDEEASFVLDLQHEQHGVDNPGTVFQVLLCREEEYQSAGDFTRNVHLVFGGDGLMVDGFAPSGSTSGGGGSGGGGGDRIFPSERSSSSAGIYTRHTPADFSLSGWRISSINGVCATKESVEAIFRLTSDEGCSGCSSPSDTILGKTSSADIDINHPMSDSVITVHSTTCIQPRYIVRFEKASGSRAGVGFGDKFMLRTVGGSSSNGVGGLPRAAVGFGAAGAPPRPQLASPPFQGTESLASEDSTRARVPSEGAAMPDKMRASVSSLDDGSSPRRMAIAEGYPGVTLIFDQVDVGSRDDPSIYMWTAEEIRRRCDQRALRSSLPEKLRSAIVVAYNVRAGLARADLRGANLLFRNRDLHLRLLGLLAELLRDRREIEVEFEGGREEVLEELRLSGEGAQDTPVVQAIDDIDGNAASAGVHVGDELVEVVVGAKGASERQLLRTAPEIHAALGLGSSSSSFSPPAAAEGPAGNAHASSSSPTSSTHAMTLFFRCRTLSPVDSGAQQVVVDHAVTIAQLLPSWGEIVVPDSTSSPDCAGILRRGEVFQLKCSVVTSMLESGWELEHAGFAEAALQLHNHFDARTSEHLEDLLPSNNATVQQLREDLLVAQLDVLTASWAAVPRIVKEHRPEVLRRLFRHDCELAAMRQGVDIVYRRWAGSAAHDAAAGSCACGGLVEMPAELQNFVERVRPMNEVSGGRHRSVAMSMGWILKAYAGTAHKEERASVKEILVVFAEIYSNTEKYWVRRLHGAAELMDRTQEQLEQALSCADVRVVFVRGAGAVEELRRMRGKLTTDHLLLKESLRVGDSDDVPKGQRLLRRGQITDHFRDDASNEEVHRRLTELAPKEGDLRLLFGGDGYHRARDEAERAIKELGAIIRVVGRAAKAFPETVHPQCQDLLEKHHKGELRSVKQENQRRLQIKEREAQEMVRIANIKLDVAQTQKVAAQAKLREAEEAKCIAEAAKVDAMVRAQQVMDLVDELKEEKQRLEAEKADLQVEKEAWIEARWRMETNQKQLTRDIEGAKEERRHLEAAVEKWQATLQRVTSKAEEKDMHLKEIQTILMSSRQYHDIAQHQAQHEGDTAASATVPPVAGESAMQHSPLISQLWGVVAKAVKGTECAPEVSSQPPEYAQAREVIRCSREEAKLDDDSHKDLSSPLLLSGST